MVRVFPVYDILMQDGWHSHSRGLRATAELEAVPTVGFNHKVSRFTFICRRTHPSHPLGIFYGENPLNYSSTLIFFEIVLVILFIRIIRFLLKPLRQPRVVSEIIGGIIIGPSVLGHSKTFAEKVFPDNAKFVIRNVGILGFMYFLFVTGVRMDIEMVRKAGRKHVYTALIGVCFPILTVGAVGFFLRPSLERELARYSGFGAIATNLAITSYPVIYLILKELNLLSSEVGRMALSTSIVGDLLGIAGIVLFEALKQAEASKKAALGYMISLVIVSAFVMIPIRRIMVWIIKKTPEGKPVDQTCVVLILTGVALLGFITDMFGIAIANGSLWLGLVIPSGPTLGATLVERSETVVMELLMPFSYAVVGMYTDVFAMANYGWSSFTPVFAMILAGYLTKLIATMSAACYFGFPWKDSLALSLVMNLRGQVELIVFIHWIDKQIIGIPMFTMFVLLTTLVTAICTPLISILYDPSRPYMVTKRRTIQHTPPGTELRIVICIYDKESVAGLINLLEISYPSLNSPFSVYALHLIELVGRGTPVFIDHDKQEEVPAKYKDDGSIHHALRLYQETRDEFVKLSSFTVETPKRTMYQDICKLALTNKATLIILPFDTQSLDNIAGTEIVRHGLMQSINSNVLSHAPCSVGILVDKAHDAHNTVVGQSFRHLARKFVLLFLGGADAREALTYADRMAMNPDVSLMVIRFLSHNNEGDDEIEKKLDDGVVTWFWVKNEGNERVVYREVVVKNGEETVAAIQALNDNTNDLWIVGRKQGINPVLLQGLSTWTENDELGIIGDFVASLDFGGTASVLVVHQQIMRGQATAACASQGKCSIFSQWM